MRILGWSIVLPLDCCTAATAGGGLPWHGTEPKDVWISVSLVQVAMGVLKKLTIAIKYKSVPVYIHFADLNTRCRYCHTLNVPHWWLWQAHTLHTCSKKLHSGYIISIIEIRSMPGMLNDEGNKDTTPAISFLHAKLSTMVYFVPVPL